MDWWMFGLHQPFFGAAQRVLQGGGSGLLIYLLWSSSRSGNLSGSERERAQSAPSAGVCHWRGSGWLVIELPCALGCAGAVCSRLLFPRYSWAVSSLWVDAFHNQRNIKYLWGGLKKKKNSMRMCTGCQVIKINCSEEKMVFRAKRSWYHKSQPL